MTTFVLLGSEVATKAATAIAESRIHIRLSYKHRDTQQAISIFATGFAGVSKNGMLILPESFSGSEEPLMRVLDFHRQLWETLNEQGSEAAGEKVHPNGRASFVRESEELAANGYPLAVKWIAWTEDVWILGGDVTQKSSPGAAPKTRPVVERYVLDPETGELFCYWEFRGDNVYKVLTDESVQQQLNDYIKSLQ